MSKGRTPENTGRLKCPKSGGVPMVGLQHFGREFAAQAVSQTPRNTPPPTEVYRVGTGGDIGRYRGGTPAKMRRNVTTIARAQPGGRQALGVHDRGSTRPPTRRTAICQDRRLPRNGQRKVSSQSRAGPVAQCPERHGLPICTSNRPTLEAQRQRATAHKNVGAVHLKRFFRGRATCSGLEAIPVTYSTSTLWWHRSTSYRSRSSRLQSYTKCIDPLSAVNGGCGAPTPGREHRHYRYSGKNHRRRSKWPCRHGRRPS
jgi:hypothetical protein